MKKIALPLIVLLAMLAIGATVSTLTTSNVKSLPQAAGVDSGTLILGLTNSATMRLFPPAMLLNGSNISGTVPRATAAVTATNIAGTTFTGSITVVTNGIATMSLLFTNGVLRAVAAP